MHPYKLEQKYTDASGLRFRMLMDPNAVIKYFEQIEILRNFYNETGITDIYELGEMANIPLEILERIDQFKTNYERCLIKH